MGRRASGEKVDGTGKRLRGRRTFRLLVKLSLIFQHHVINYAWMHWTVNRFARNSPALCKCSGMKRIDLHCCIAGACLQAAFFHFGVQSRWGNCLVLPLASYGLVSIISLLLFFAVTIIKCRQPIFWYFIRNPREKNIQRSEQWNSNKPT